MGKGKDLTEEQQNLAARLLTEKRYSQREVARILDVSQTAVRNVAGKIRNNAPLKSKKPGRSGRPRCTTVRDDRIIIRELGNDRFISCQTLCNKMAELGIGTSKRTLRRRMKEAGFKGLKPTKKPRLTLRMKKARLEWAKQFRTWRADDWARVCFTDESHMEILGVRASHVYRRPGEAFDEKCTIPTVKHPTKVMVWGLIASKGMGPLHFVDGMMDRYKYSEVLLRRMLPQVWEWFPDGNYIFMHDKAPCHTARCVSELFAEYGVEVLPWPGNSPDLNPIENVWANIKLRLREAPEITSEAQLKERLRNIWENDPDLITIVQNCIQSMPDRVAAVIAAGGGATKY